MAFVIEHDSNGYTKIFIEYGTNRCAHIMFRYDKDTDTIGLAHVSCTCPRLKGRCLKILLSKMIYSPDFTDNTKVELMVEPDELEGKDKKLAMQKLISHYSKYGFTMDPELLGLMVSTVGQISSIVDVPEVKDSTKKSIEEGKGFVEITTKTKGKNKKGRKQKRRGTKKKGNKKVKN